MISKRTLHEVRQAVARQTQDFDQRTAECRSVFCATYADIHHLLNQDEQVVLDTITNDREYLAAILALACIGHQYMVIAVSKEQLEKIDNK